MVAISDLASAVPNVLDDGVGDDERAILRLLAIVLSVLTAAEGEPRILFTHHPNVAALLNNALHLESWGTKRYASVFDLLLKRTTLCASIQPSVWKHIARAQAEHDQEGPSGSTWQALKYLVPEIFDPVVREELIYLQMLPHWANPPAPAPAVKSYLETLR